jgi:FkbH-like protein
MAQARKVVGSASLSDSRHLSLLCSFEPGALAVYLQAVLALRFPKETPRLLTSGYNGLLRALTEPAGTQPAFLLLTWEDLHPGLSWRTRRAFSPITGDEMMTASSRLRELLQQWISQRRGIPTYVSTAPVSWLPLLESTDPRTLSPTATAAAKLMAELVQMLAGNGARVLAAQPADLNLRDLLSAGCPLSRADSARIAAELVEVAYPVSPPKKVLVLDLDNTLWAGTLDEDEEVVCDTTARGYPFYLFQQFAKKLSQQGVVLALCSRNLHDEAADRFNAMEMPLRLSDFAAVQINTGSKVDSIAQICTSLNVLPGSVVFVDDNPAQLAEVGARLPEVECVQTPAEGAGWLALFELLQRRFAKWELTAEDSLRSQTITRPVPRAGSSFAHLHSLALQIVIAPNAGSDRRARELINKTNQFNMTGKRWDEDEWQARSPESGCVIATLADRHGDFGSISVALYGDDGYVHVDNLVLSCRAFGYGVEYAVLAHLAGLGGGEFVEGGWSDTGRNAAARAFLQNLGAEFFDGGWRVSRGAIQHAYDKFLADSGAQVSVTGGVRV